MNRRDFARLIATRLKKQDSRKSTRSRSKVFHISDDEGNSKDFVLKSATGGALYNITDVEVILDEAIGTALDLIKHGDSVSIQGFGTLGVRYTKARSVKDPNGGSDFEVNGHYRPKFVPGTDLKLAAKLFGSFEADREAGRADLVDKSFWAELDDNYDGDDDDGEPVLRTELALCDDIDDKGGK